MSHNEKVPNQTELKKLRSLVEDIRIAMLTNMDEDSNLRSRPMYTQQIDEVTGEIWFFASDESLKTMEVRKCGTVNLAYAEPKSNSYVSISGDATLSRDRAKIDELWSPATKAWFPEGKEDPRLCLIKVRIEHAEYWDSPSSKVVTLFALAKSLLTGEKVEKVGDHQGLDYTGRHA